MDEEIRSAQIAGKSTLKAAWINGICVIISVIVGAFLGALFENLISENRKPNNDIIKIENSDLQTQIENLSDAYENLTQANSRIQDENYTLQSQINSLKDEVSKYNSLAEENAALKDRVQQLENELQLVKNADATEPGTQDNIGLNSNDSNTYIQITGGDIIRVRSAPDTSSNIIGSVDNGTKVLFVNTVKGTDGHEWYEVPVGDQTGYIRSEYANIVD